MYKQLIYSNFSINLEKCKRYWYNCPRKIEKEIERRNRSWHGSAMFAAREQQPEIV